jgi:hypothetical protein
MKKEMVFKEMARRYKRFHGGDAFSNINLWLLTYPSEVKKFVGRYLIPYNKEEAKCLNWYYPTEKGIEEINKYMGMSLEELEKDLFND